MYVCSTKKGDVGKAIKDMLKNHKERKTCAGPLILQVSMKDYKRLKTITAQAEMMEEVKQREVKYVINTNTITVHKKDCGHTGKAVIKAILTTPKTTGLWPCTHCKPWVAPLTW